MPLLSSREQLLNPDTYIGRLGTTRIQLEQLYTVIVLGFEPVWVPFDDGDGAWFLLNTDLGLVMVNGETYPYAGYKPAKPLNREKKSGASETPDAALLHSRRIFDNGDWSYTLIDGARYIFRSDKWVARYGDTELERLLDGNADEAFRMVVVGLYLMNLVQRKPLDNKAQG